MNVETEALLMFAARREHIAKVIVPALAVGRWVLSDRFTDATYAYQGAGRGMAVDKIAALEDWVQEGLQPDLTLVFDVPVEIARQRLAQSPADRFEREGAGFFERIRTGYLKRAATDSPRVRVINSEKPLADVKKEVQNIIATLC
jgi:dTMP kinase